MSADCQIHNRCNTEIKAVGAGIEGSKTSGDAAQHPAQNGRGPLRLNTSQFFVAGLVVRDGSVGGERP